MASNFGAMIMRPLGVSIPVNFGDPSNAKCNLATYPSQRNRLIRLVKPISRFFAPTKWRKVCLGSAEETTRALLISVPSVSSTPVAISPVVSPSMTIRLTKVPVCTVTPAFNAALCRALTKFAMPPSGNEWAPWCWPLMRYNILNTVALGERGAILEPIRPSQLSMAFNISLSKFSSIKSRAGSVATRMNSPISFLPKRRNLRPSCPNVIRSGKLLSPIRGIVFSQNGLSILAKRFSSAR